MYRLYRLYRACRALLRPAMFACAAMHQRAPLHTIVKHIAFIATRGAPCSAAGPVTAAAARRQPEAGHGARTVVVAAAGGDGYLLLLHASRLGGGGALGGGECSAGGDRVVGVFFLVVVLDELLHPSILLERNNAHDVCALPWLLRRLPGGDYEAHQPANSLQRATLPWHCAGRSGGG